MPISMGFTPAGTIVPVPHTGHKLRGVTVPSLRHRGLAGLSPAPLGGTRSPTALGVEPGHYRDSVSDGE